MGRMRFGLEESSSGNGQPPRQLGKFSILPTFIELVSGSASPRASVSLSVKQTWVKDSIRLWMPVLKVWPLEQPQWWHLGRNLQEMQVLRSHPRSPKLETLGWDPACSPLGDAGACQKKVEQICANSHHHELGYREAAFHWCLYQWYYLVLPRMLIIVFINPTTLIVFIIIIHR